MIKFCFLSQNSKIYIIILQIYFFQEENMESRDYVKLLDAPLGSEADVFKI